MARKSKYLSAQPLSETSVHYLAGQYGRLSVEDGDDTESNSIGNQAKSPTLSLRNAPTSKSSIGMLTTAIPV